MNDNTEFSDGFSAGYVAGYRACKDRHKLPWIPCSERLPEHRLYVLVTYKYEYGLIDNGITWYSETENKWNTSREVIAWMPLPEPYAERRTDETD